MRTLLVLALALSACGGSEEGMPLISGAVNGVYKGQPFQAEFGFGTLYEDVPIIGVGDGPLNCGSVNQQDPPSGTNALIAVPELAVGEYSNVLIEIMQNHGDFEGEGSNMGTV